MARSRNIKPGFFKNEDLAECSVNARLCFIGLWLLADREGRLEDRPKRIKAELFAFDSLEVEPLLVELSTHKFIERYRNEDGLFIQISKFLAHQTPHYTEKNSVIKPPLLQESAPFDETPTPGVQRDDAAATPRTLQEKTRSKRGSKPPDLLIPDSLIPEEDSVPNGTGALAPESGPPEPERPPLTAKDKVWILGPPLLGDTGSNRAMLGKLAKSYGEDVLAEVLAQATVERPIDPKAWITAACEARKAKGAAHPQNGAAGMLDDPRPDWALAAGFQDRFEAENEGCTRFNARQFSGGKRVA